MIPLKPTMIVEPEWHRDKAGNIYRDSSGKRYSEAHYTHGKSRLKPMWNNQTPSGQNKLGPSANRAMLRSETYQGIADAMADQWYEALFAIQHKLF